MGVAKGWQRSRIIGALGGLMLAAVAFVPPPASAGLLDDLFEQVDVLDSISYRFVTSYDAGGGKLIERSHDAVANVPTLLDVDDKFGPDVTATLSSLDGKTATLSVTTIGAAKLPLAVQTLLPDPGERSMYFGYDARTSAAPTSFTAKLSLVEDTKVIVDSTIGGAQPGGIVVNGGTFTPVDGKRADPVIVAATFDKTPEKAKIEADLGPQKRFALTSSGGMAALVRADIATGQETDRIEAYVPVLPTWVQVRYEADDELETRHVVYDASSKAPGIAFAYTQFLAGVEQQRTDVALTGAPQKADIVQDAKHVRLWTSTSLDRIDVALRAKEGLMEIGGKTVRSLLARADGVPTDVTIDYRGGTDGYRVTPASGQLDLVQLRLSSELTPADLPDGLGGRAWGGTAPGDLAASPGTGSGGSRGDRAPAPAPPQLPGRSGPSDLATPPTRGATHDAIVYLRDLASSFDLFAQVSSLRSTTIVLDPLPDVRVDSVAGRPLVVDARTEEKGKSARTVSGKLSPLPPNVRVRVKDSAQGGKHVSYSADGPADSLLLTGTGIPFMARGSAFQVEATTLPKKIDVQLEPSGKVSGSTETPVGDLTLRLLDKVGTQVSLPDPEADGVVFEDRRGRFAAMVRVRALSSFNVDPSVKHARVALDSLSGRAFTADIHLDLNPGINLSGTINNQNSKPDRSVSARIKKLARNTSLQLLDLGPGQGSRIDYAADSTVPEVTLIADGYRLAPRGDHAQLRLIDLPSALSVLVADNGTVTATAPAGAPIGVVELMLTDGPKTVIMPPGDKDGVNYMDTKKAWGFGVRVSKLQSTSAGTAPHPKVAVDSAAGKPFEVDLRFADGDRVVGKLSALPRNVRLALAPTKDGQQVTYLADGPIGSLQVVGHGVLDIARAPQVRLTAEDIPSKLTVDLGDHGSLAGKVDGKVGRIELIATDDVDKTYAPWTDPHLQNEHAFVYHDVPDRRFFIGVRVYGLRSFSLPATENLVVEADADQRPLTVEIHTPFAAPKKGETTDAEPFVNNSAASHEYYRMRLDEAQRHTRVALDLADRGAESVSDVTYEADAVGPGFSLISNAGGHQLTTATITPMPKKLHVCASSYRWCATSDGFVIKKNLGAQPDGPFKGGVPNIGGSYYLKASSPVKMTFIDCVKSAGSCLKKPGLDAKYDGVQIRDMTFQKLAMDASGTKFDSIALSDGLKGHMWVDTDEHPLTGQFVLRDPGGDVASINMSFPANFRTHDRLTVFKASRPLLEHVAENKYWADGAIACNGGPGLDGWFKSEQVLQVYRKGLCEAGHPAVPK